MSEAIAILCLATSIGAAWLLLRGWGRSRVGLLLWSGVWFLFLTASNLLLTYSTVTPGRNPELDFYMDLFALAGILPLVSHLVWGER